MTILWIAKHILISWRRIITITIANNVDLTDNLVNGIFDVDLSEEFTEAVVVTSLLQNFRGVILENEVQEQHLDDGEGDRECEKGLAEMIHLLDGAVDYVEWV